MRHLRSAGAAVVLTVLGAGAASAEVELNFYLGYQTSPHSRLDGEDSNGDEIDQLVGWEGRSFELPPYYGVRATWWQNAKWGWGAEFSHNKAYTPDDELDELGFERLEFTDGHNIVTLNVMRRWENHWGPATPYVGAGLGLAIPHVDAEQESAGSRTFGYQITGPAARLIAGAKYDFNDKWAMFGEYQFTWTQNHVELDGGGEFDARILGNAINFGVAYSF